MEVASAALGREVLDLHVSVEADYTSNVLPRSYPKGLDVEVLSPAALAAAHAEAEPGPDREHVTPFVFRSYPHLGARPRA